MNQNKIEKIKALLEKTVENGATEKEALLALEKAQELMKKYAIEESMLNVKEIEEIVVKTAPLVKSYPISYFHVPLAKLFGCECYVSTKEIFFFGHEGDVELCMYFYSVINNAIKNERKNYMKTDETYLRYKEYGTKKDTSTLRKDFSRGVAIGIANKLRKMKAEQQSEIDKNEKYGLVVLEKEELVKNAYYEHSLEVGIRTVQPRKITINSGSAFSNGKERGANIQMNAGIASDGNFTKRNLLN